MNNIILIGFMGCGKTSVGIRLSYKLKRTFIDTDRQIEKWEKKKITEIFAQSGEETFRELETKCLQRLLTEEEKRIISVGGGLPVREENRALLKELGTVIYLRVTADTVCERLKFDKSRPLLQGANPRERVEALLAEREPLYADAADVVIDVDGKRFERIIAEIKSAVSKRRKKRKKRKGRKK